MITAFDTVLYTIVFIVPGYIIYYVFDSIVPTKRDNYQLALIRFISFSSINCIVCLLYLNIANILNKSQYEINATISLLLIIFYVFINPLIIGLILGICNIKNVGRNIFQKFGLNPSHRIPTAWDYKFNKMKGITWIIVTLVDNNTIAGLLGENSFISSEAEERDIYLEEVYLISEDGEWEARERSDGMLIRSNFIKSIEFILESSEEDENEKEKSI